MACSISNATSHHGRRWILQSCALCGVSLADLFTEFPMFFFSFLVSKGKPYFVRVQKKLHLVTTGNVQMNGSRRDRSVQRALVQLPVLERAIPRSRGNPCILNGCRRTG